MNDGLFSARPAGPPVALTVAGSDSGGAAGIQADLKTFAARGAFGCSAITALTAQNTLGVQGVNPVPPDFVRAQLHSVLSDLPVAAIKTGMLADVGVIEAVISELSAHPRRPLVVDPVMVATSGDRLLSARAETVLREQLLPLADLITPNLPEAAALLGEPLADDTRVGWRQAERLLALGAGAVLLKGGHGEGAEARDLLLSRDGAHTLIRPRIDTPHTHGSGCTLSAAIAAALARGLAMTEAVVEARDYLQGALRAARHWRLGSGAGPLDHQYGLRHAATASSLSDLSSPSLTGETRYDS